MLRIILMDLLFLIGEKAKYIGEESEKRGLNPKSIFYFQDKELLLQELKKNLQEGDIILFKASNGMKLFEVVENLKKELEA